MPAMHRFHRDRGPISGVVFVVAPFGVAKFVAADGEPSEYDFDEHYNDVIVPAVEEAGLKPVRSDSLFDGGDTIAENVWARLQEAQIVIADLTGSNRNVMLEFGWAYLLNKPIIPLTQCASDVPSDLPGLRFIQYTPHWRDMGRMKTELINRLEVLSKEPSAEWKLAPMETSTVRPVAARVVSVAKEHVVVEAEKGQLGVLGPADVDLARVINDMTHRFTVGEMLDGAFETSEGYTKYTLVAGQANPWPQLAIDFPAGHVFTGKVVNVIDGVGAFVRVAKGVNGLVSTAALRGAAPPRVGDAIDVGVVRTDVAGRRITLSPASGGPASGRPVAMVRQAAPGVGERFDAEVMRVAPENGRAGGFALVRLPGYPGNAMLHCTRMSPDVRADLNEGRLEPGELLLVEVVRIDQQGRAVVRDIEDQVPAGEAPEPELQAAA